MKAEEYCDYMTENILDGNQGRITQSGRDYTESAENVG